MKPCTISDATGFDRNARRQLDPRTIDPHLAAWPSGISIQNRLGLKRIFGELESIDLPSFVHFDRDLAVPFTPA
jgi:hypothetical protein